MEAKSDDGSDNEWNEDLASSLPERLSSDEFPATTSNIIKSQFDKIFSEVQRNLPTIDFDLSDVSSDNDEPIFFHQSLKLGEFSSRFDDDKDLDTSLGAGDSPLLSKPAVANTVYSNANMQAQISDNENVGDASFDNDLAALFSQATFPTTEEIASWKDMADRMEAAQREEERRDNEDIKRTRQLQTLSKSHSIGTNTESTDNTPDISHSLTVAGEDKPIYINQVDIEIDENLPSGITSNFASSTEDRFARHMQEMDKKEQRRHLAERLRIKDEEIVSKFTTEEPPTLSMRFFEDMDLDSIIETANSEQIPLSSLRVIGRPTADQIPEKYAGGDSVSQTEGHDDMTMIQKLVQLSMAQSGATLERGLKEIQQNFNPQTGASLTHSQPSADYGLITNEQPTMKMTEGKTKKDQSSGGNSTNTSSAGTSTFNFSGAGKVLYGRVRPERKETEPATVFIDLRGFERQKEEEQQGLMSVQRVLGLPLTVAGEEDSSSDEEEMVERCNWRHTRDKIKKELTTQGVSASLKGAVGKTRKDSQPAYRKPARVINLQEHTVSRRWARNSSNQDDNSDSIERAGVDSVQGTAGIEQEMDNREWMAKLEAEKEEERLREVARKLRVEREKEREARLRMNRHLDATRSTASTLGKQNAGETTPIVFDLEASYEPAPSALPTVLSTDVETLLLTIHLSSNGEIVQHRSKINRSVDTGEGLSATYTALLSWLLSLVPDTFSFLDKTSTSTPPSSSSSSSSSTSTSSPPSEHNSTFHVIGLQQMWYEEQLCLYVVVTPSERFIREAPRHSRSKKNKKDDVKDSSRFAQHITKFMSVNTLSTVCPWLSTLVSVPVGAERPEDKYAPGYSYEPPLPKFSTKPLSTFVQVTSEPQAAFRKFNIPVGFFWQTVDNDEIFHDIECGDSDVTYETQNTMSLVYKKIFQNPLSIMAILNRVSQEGLDLAGVRLLYPCPGLVELQTVDKSKCSPLELLNRIGPVFAMALRGTFARSIWLDAVGPSDPALARRTDPNSLCALYGGDSRDNALLFCPRNPSRVQTELARWCGGRIQSGTMSIDVGIPYSETEDVVRGKRARKSGMTPDPKRDAKDCEIHRPPAALTATSKADIFLVLSPLVPPSYFGVIMATGQRRGFQIRGVKRILLTAKMAASLGIASSSQSSFFCPGARTDEFDTEGRVGAIAPSTIFILRKENAAHNAPSLIEAFMVQLTLAGLLGCVQMRVKEPLTSKHLFHAATYSDGVMFVLGNTFSKTAEFDLTHLRLSSSLSYSVRKDMEQIAVVVLVGHDALRKCGMIIAKILNVLPYSKNPMPANMPLDRFELLGIKWVPCLSMHQAKELTPFEIGDKQWKDSIKMLASEPALVLALRGVNIFYHLKPLVDEQQHQENSGRGGYSTSSSFSSSGASKEPKQITCLMSHNPSQSDVLARLFFQGNELFPDPLARSLLPFLPEFRLYFNIIEETANEREGKRIFSLKPLNNLNLTRENVLEEMAAGQQTISTFLLVKPMAVKKHLPKILRKVIQAGFHIVGMKLLVLDELTARVFVTTCLRKNDKEITVLQKHIQATTSGPCLALSLRQQNGVKKLCDLVGPEEPMSARRQSQFLWRGEFGTDIFNNGLYCSSCYVDAVRDQKIIFTDGLCCHDNSILSLEQIPAPAEDTTIDLGHCHTCELKTTLTSSGCSNVQGDESSGDVLMKDVHTFLFETNCLVLTPPLMKMGARSKECAGLELMNMLISHGFQPTGCRLVWLTRQQAEVLLAILGRGSFQLVSMLCSGPCLVLAMDRDNAILAFSSILDHSTEGRRLMNEYGELILRGSDQKEAHSLLTFFFDQLMPGSHLTICRK